MEIKSLLNKELLLSDEKHIKLSDVFCHHFNIKELGNIKSYQVRFLTNLLMYCFLIDFNELEIYC